MPFIWGHFSNGILQCNIQVPVRGKRQKQQNVYLHVHCENLKHTSSCSICAPSLNYERAVVDKSNVLLLGGQFWENVKEEKGKAK